MQRLLPILLLVVLASACGVVAPSGPAPTPTSLKPANLLTPRPTLPAPTPTPRVVATPGTLPPTRVPTPTPSAQGTPVPASEPLQGTLLDDRLLSPIIGASFPYRVYLPPDYQHSPQKRYPVLYMLHGAGGNYTEWTDSFLPEQADRMMVAGEIPQMIVVMPDDGGQTYWANWSEGGPRWGDYLTEDVVAAIDQRYRTLPNAQSRGIGGATARQDHRAEPVGAHSPSVRLEPDPTLWFLQGQTFWDNDPVWLAQNRPGLDSLTIWLDAGSEDVWLPNIEAVHAALVDEGLHPIWHLFPGPHEAEYWIEHLPDYLRFYGGALRS